jgi:PPOX class probable F420-dependent enzyme
VPKSPVPAEVAEFLLKPNPAVMSSNRPDGQPVSVATWYIWEDGRILINMQEDRKRLDYLREDPRVSLTVLDNDNWYTHISLQGRITTWKDDTDLADVDRLSIHYGGRAYPNRERGRVSAWIDVDRWHGWGAFAKA